MAILHGVIIGIAAVAIVGFIIVGTNGQGKDNAGGETTPASGPAISPDEAPLKLFAKQHGVFSSVRKSSRIWSD